MVPWSPSRWSCRPPWCPARPDRQILEGLFDVFDASGDGELTRAEWTEPIEQELGFADADGDGRITLEELAVARENLDLGGALGIVF